MTGCARTMRILVLVEACGGVARHVVDLCAGLQARGIEVHLLYSPKRADAVLTSGLQRLSTLGIRSKAVVMGPEPGLADLRAWREIRHYLRDHGPFDIIHGHSSKAGALARLSGIASRMVKIYTPHAFVTMNSAMPPARRLLYRSIERFLDMLGDAVIATSPAEFEHARSCLHIPEKKLFLVTNGIALPAEGAGRQREALRRAWGVRDDEVVIGTVARLVPQKAPELLLRAFAEVVRCQQKARLIMVGDGPLREGLEMEAARLGVSDAVVWPGYLEDPQVMCAFDVFALGSRYEGFPYVLLDALAAGLPMVTTAVGGTELVVDEGSNGIVVPIGGEKKMAEALSGLVADADKRLRMGAASRIKVESFGVDRMVDETVKVYETCRGIHCQDYNIAKNARV